MRLPPVARFTRFVFLALVTSLFLSPGALAHGSAFESSVSDDMLEVYARVEGAPLVVAQAPLMLHVALSGPTAASVGEVRAVLSPAGADAGAAAGIPLEPKASDANASSAHWFEGSFLLPAAGDWTLHVFADGREAAAFDFPALRAGRAFLDWADASEAVVVEGLDGPPLVQFMSAARHPLPPPADATARLLRESDDGAWVEAGSARLVDGRLPVDDLAPGAYLVHLAAPSLGLMPDDRPPLGLLVVPAEEAAVYEAPAPQETPGPAGVWTLAAVLAAAAVLGRCRAVDRRRRP